MIRLSAMPPLRSTLLAVAALSAPASAQLLPVNSCVLLPVTPGGLGTAENGTALSSSGTGGVKATMSVTITGARPTVKVAPPQLSGPAASLSGATTTVAYSSLAGAAQPPTSAASAYSPNALTDVVTFDARVRNTAGFRAGSYTVSLTVTCEL